MALETERKFLVPLAGDITSLGFKVVPIKSTTIRLLKQDGERAWEASSSLR